jgi:hypothetical protein
MRRFRRRIGVPGLIVVTTLCVGRGLADDKPPTSPPPATKDVKKYVQVGNLAGKLKKVTLNTSEGELEYHSGVGRYAKTEKMDLTFADEVKVWFVGKPPQRIDENGDPKKYTPAELDKMKSHFGATKGWYAGELADIHSGQTVQVALSKPKDAMRKPAVKDKNAPAEKEFVYVTQIVVTADEKPAQAEKKKP